MKTLKIEQISTDILIIGGGAAGSWAAIEADRRGVDVLLITKGKLGKSGCSPLAAMYLFPPEGTPGYNPETRFIEEVGSLTRATYLNNQELLRAIVFEASRYVTKLEELGLYWTRYPDGELAIGFTKGKPADIYAITHGDTGKNIMDVLRKEIIRRGIKFLEDTMVTRLLTKNDEVVGATALDYIHGKFLIIRAKSVILAAGGGGCLWKYSTASREVTADGLAIAFRAGAELTNIEFNLWHMADLGRRPGMKPIAWVNLQIYPSVTPKRDKTMWAPIFLNKKGERFMKMYEESFGMLKHQQMMMVMDQIKKGFADKEGGIYADIRHVDPEDLKLYWHPYDYLRKLGIDTTKDLIEVGTSAHWMDGGIKIDSSCETNLRGLYAAGGNSAGGATIAGCLYTGEISAKSAVKRAYKIQQHLEIDREQVEEEEERVSRYLSKLGVDGLSPVQIKKKIRELMYEKMHYIKNEKMMMEALNGLHEIREKFLPNMNVKSPTAFHMLAEALEVENMLTVAELIIEVSLIRKESRGVFQREDYPEMDNENWLKNIVVRQEEGKKHIYFSPVELTYIQPR